MMGKSSTNADALDLNGDFFSGLFKCGQLDFIPELNGGLQLGTSFINCILSIATFDFQGDPSKLTPRRTKMFQLTQSSNRLLEGQIATSWGSHHSSKLGSYQFNSTPDIDLRGLISKNVCAVDRVFGPSVGNQHLDCDCLTSFTIQDHLPCMCMWACNCRILQTSIAANVFGQIDDECIDKIDINNPAPMSLHFLFVCVT